jgi:pimeloyl-ACP methyl ester carboxylesterase
MDIVCHSRGGLVARSIAERPGDLAPLGPRTSVSQIVLVGVVNQGTILADAENWGELVDRFTSLLHLLPGPGIADTLETVLAVVKSIAIGVVEELEGLSAMAPGSEFLQQLNTGPKDPASATYRAITSDFEPSDPGLKAWLNDEVRDRIFENKANDMMVTIESMAGANGSARFPIKPASTRRFAAAEAVEHSDYFGQALTSSAFGDWLKG